MVNAAPQPLHLPAFLTQALLILAFIATLFSMGLGCGQAAAQTTASAMPCHNTSDPGQIACIKICMTSLAPLAFAPSPAMPAQQAVFHPTSIAFLETTLRPDVPPPRL